MLMDQTTRLQVPSWLMILADATNFVAIPNYLRGTNMLYACVYCVEFRYKRMLNELLNIYIIRVKHIIN